MKNILLLIVFTTVCITTFSQNIIGTYKIRGLNSSFYTKCRQLTLFSASTYENITCGETVFPYRDSWVLKGDTVYFKGSVLGLPTSHSKFLLKRNKLYAVNKENEIDKYWTFKRKNKRPRHYEIKYKR